MAVCQVRLIQIGEVFLIFLVCLTIWAWNTWKPYVNLLHDPTTYDKIPAAEIHMPVKLVKQSSHQKNA